MTPWTAAHQAPQSMGFCRQEYWSGLPCPPPGDLHNPGIKLRSPELWADSLPAEPEGKPKDTGVGSLSLLQWIFPTQELNWGLLHCRWILYQLSYQGSPGSHSTHLENSSSNNNTSPTHLPGLLWDHMLSILSIHPSPCSSPGKISAGNEGDLGLIPRL